MGARKKETCHGVLITMEGEPKKWPLYMKKTLPPPLNIGPEILKTPILADYLYFHNRWSGPFNPKQSCKTHEIGQIFHQDQPSICLCLNVRDHAMTAFQLTLK